ncbi:unnamed protein product [Ixodes pacificus]
MSPETFLYSSVSNNGINKQNKQFFLTLFFYVCLVSSV